jgi:isoleucyl-tRNA synthetase
MAPVTPHLSEAMYQRLIRVAEKGAPESVHHCDWPTCDAGLVDEELIADMDLAITVSGLGRSARSRTGIKLRQPLQEAIVITTPDSFDRLDRVSDLIREELNVKDLEITSDRSILESRTVKPVPRLLGRKHGRLFVKVAEAVRALSQEEAEKFAEGKPVTVSVEGTDIEILPDEVEIESAPREGYSVMEGDGLLVGVCTTITDELSAEGLARDIVRRIQSLRKEANFDIDDDILTYYQADPEIVEVFQEEADYIRAETLSEALDPSEPPEDAFKGTFEIGAYSLRLSLVKVKK